MSSLIKCRLFFNYFVFHALLFHSQCQAAAPYKKPLQTNEVHTSLLITASAFLSTCGFITDWTVCTTWPVCGTFSLVIHYSLLLLHIQLPNKQFSMWAARFTCTQLSVRLEARAEKRRDPRCFKDSFKWANNGSHTCRNVVFESECNQIMFLASKWGLRNAGRSLFWTYSCYPLLFLP